MIAALLWLALLSPSAPILWVERVDGAACVTADLRPLFDQRLRRRLMSGLSVTLDAQIELRRYGEEAPIGFTWRTARVRWDLWDEALTVDLHTPQAHRLERYPAIEPFILAFAQLKRARLLEELGRDGQVYQVFVRLDVNPLTPDELIETRRWMASMHPQSTFHPINDRLFGSFARFFDNFKGGSAERSLTARGHPFRADRLPEVRVDGSP
ncbi:hypothetical protein KKF91_14335 [Myxococcota bacterium]|nr:hypothetical protein [Myxococcota bacterium]MBU1896697.1 hypothetical protein [Myxococcota bacterium]